MTLTFSQITIISIHALREEGDPLSEEDYNSCRKFLSTPSARRATENFTAALKDKLFLSTPSARRATRRAGSVRGMAVFLSTPSARRATPVPQIIAHYA